MQLHSEGGQPWPSEAYLRSLLLLLNGSQALNIVVDPLHSASRIGTCGNGLCEVGEAVWRPSEEDTSSVDFSCREDCPWLRSLACPSVNGSICNGHGICLYLSGECSCFEQQGYTGSACTQCATGFVRSENRCLAVPSPAVDSPTQPPSLLQLTAAPTLKDGGQAALGILSWAVPLAAFSLLLVVCLCFYLRCKTRPEDSDDKSPVVVPEKEVEGDDSEWDGELSKGGFPPGIRYEGWLRRWTDEQGWLPREYYVLDNKLRALRFFSGVVDATPFNMYTGELGAIALKHLAFVRSDEKHLRVFHLAVSIEEEDTVLLKFLAPSKKHKKEWVQEISYFVANDAIMHKANEDKASDQESRSDEDSEPELLEATAWSGGSGTRKKQGGFEIEIV